MLSPSDSPDQPTLVLVSDDLMFPSRVREATRPLGYALKVVAGETALRTAVATDPPPIAILVNLTARRYDPLALIAAMKSDEAAQAIPLLAFAGHVERDKQEAARQAGADRVAANSSVSLHLPALLTRLLSGAPSSHDVEDFDG